jgi:hypothetical protein
MRFDLFPAIGVAIVAASTSLSAGPWPEMPRLGVNAAATGARSVAVTNAPAEFTIGPSADLLLYDNTQGRLVNGWADCSSADEFAHYDMTGMNGIAEFVLHTGTKMNGFLGFCKSGGTNTAGYNALEFFVFPDWYNTGQNVDIAFRTSAGQTVTRSIDAFIVGGAAHLVVGKWNRVVVPFSSLGLQNVTVDRIQFVGRSVTESGLLFDEVKFSGSGAALPAPPSNVRITR